MTKVPPPPDPDDPRHAADAAFYRSLNDLAQRTAEPKRAEARRRRRRRVAVAGVVPALALAASGAVATKVFIVGNGSVPLEREPGKRFAPLRSARAEDPKTKDLWGVQLSYNIKGETCVIAGPVRDGAVGAIQDGQFKTLPEGAPGTCHDMRDHLFSYLSYFPDNPGGPRTVLAGAIDPTIVRVDFRARDGRLETVPIALDRSFILVAPGVRPFQGSALVTMNSKGRSSTRPLADLTPLNP